MNEIIIGLKKGLEHLIEHEAKELRELNLSMAPVQDEIVFFEDNWVGEWMSEYYDCYKGLQRNGQTARINNEYIFEKILKDTGVDLKHLADDIKVNIDTIKNFNNNLIAEISFVRDDEKYRQEAQILDELEKYLWGSDIGTIISFLRPSQMYVEDVRLINKGTQTPPHIFIKAYYLTLETRCGACNNYIDLVKRLIRQVEIKIGHKQSNTSEDILTSIFNNFHQFARQIVNRHDNRSSIVIKDEYDVQDLIHAILRLHFSDVREEEYTPSYAGSSTRMDFLLKNEEIVIEVKKTRSNLKDKEIGEQLILDVAHYKNHPNCSVLYCFVYDPESKVKNSRGLESDLSKQSNENLEIKVFIRP